MQDHDLTLRPQSNLKFFLGFSRNTQTGPALTTANVDLHTGDEYTLFENVRRQQTQYRLGGEAKLLGFRLNVLRGWENFREDTPLGLNAPSAGANQADRNTLSRYSNVEPVHGNSPFWRVALFREHEKYFAVNGRFTYTSGRRNFVSDETLLGGSRFGAYNRFIQTFGDARRPVATGNLTLSVFPASRITLTNHTAIYNTRIDGNATYRQFEDGSLDFTQFNFSYLGIRTFSNATDATIQASPWLGIVAGYQYTNRRIRTVDAVGYNGDAPDSTAYEQTNTVHSGRFGIRLRPVKPLTITLDSEIGRADQPLYTTSDKNFHTLGGRIQYKVKTFLISGYTRANYNFNSNSLTAFSSHARAYGIDGSWNRFSWLSLNAGYSRLHTDTLAGIAYFAAARQRSGQYAYLSNVNSVYANAHISIRKRAELLLGLSQVEDVGDGRATGPLYQLTANPFAFSAETFPMAFTSPLGRLSVKIHQKVRWNAGYQFYGYRQSLVTPIIPLQGYRAHTGYTSLAWSF